MAVSYLRENLLQLPRLQKQVIAIGSDVLLCAAASFASVSLRFEAVQPWVTIHSWMLIVGLLIAVPLFTVFGL